MRNGFQGAERESESEWGQNHGRVGQGRCATGIIKLQAFSGT